MFDTPVDAWYAWLGLAAVSVATLGVVLALPAAGPPSAASLAATVDQVATSEFRATGSVPVTAAAVSVGSTRIAVRGPGGASAAAYLARSVVPVDAGRLAGVLGGTPPREVFATPAAFREALEAHRVSHPPWEPAPDRLRVRRVVWGEVDATLVG